MTAWPFEFYAIILFVMVTTYYLMNDDDGDAW